MEQGYWLKFAIKRVVKTLQRPHGLSYTFTLHDPDGKRLVGFDNAHGVGSLGSGLQQPRAEHDHWHRTGDDPGRPYAFTTADQLLADFFTEVTRVLAELGIDGMVIGPDDKNEME